MAIYSVRIQSSLFITQSFYPNILTKDTLQLKTSRCFNQNCIRTKNIVLLQQCQILNAFPTFEHHQHIRFLITLLSLSHAMGLANNIFEEYLKFSSPLTVHNTKTYMFLVLSRNCLCPIHWSQVLIREWRCSWGAGPTGDAPTISESSTNLLLTKVRLILEVRR